MSKGGGASNNASVMMQQQEAAEARRKEEERKARIDQGMKAIERIFGGTAVMGTRKANVDFSKFDPTGYGGKGTPAATWMGPAAAGTDFGLAGGLKYRTRDMTAAEAKTFEKQNKGKAGTTAAAAATTPNMFASGIGSTGDNALGNAYVEGQGPVPGTYAPGGPKGTTAAAGGAAAKNQMHEIVDANGNVIGTAFSLEDLKKGKFQFDEKYDTGKKKGGVGDELYNKYRKSQHDYYDPKITDQFNKAKEDTTYAHANAGTLLSSMATANAADLVGQNKQNKAQVSSQIEDSVGQLKRSVLSDKAALINQLYATENPTMASNEALAKVRTINNSTPPLSPLGDLFKTAAIGAGSFLQAANDPYRSVNYGAGKSGGAGRVIQS